jgi:hypothetical protein
MTGRNEWAVNQRLLFIERRLQSKGRVNRSDLMGSAVPDKPGL